MACKSASNRLCACRWFAHGAGLTPEARSSTSVLKILGPLRTEFQCTGLWSDVHKGGHYQRDKGLVAPGVKVGEENDD